MLLDKGTMHATAELLDQIGWQIFGLKTAHIFSSEWLSAHHEPSFIVMCYHRDTDNLDWMLSYAALKVVNIKSLHLYIY